MRVNEYDFHHGNLACFLKAVETVSLDKNNMYYLGLEKLPNNALGRHNP